MNRFDIIQSEKKASSPSHVSTGQLRRLCVFLPSSTGKSWATRDYNSLRSLFQPLTKSKTFRAAFDAEEKTGRRLCEIDYCTRVTMAGNSLIANEIIEKYRYSLVVECLSISEIDISSLPDWATRRILAEESDSRLRVHRQAMLENSSSSFAES